MGDQLSSSEPPHVAYTRYTLGGLYNFRDNATLLMNGGIYMGGEQQSTSQQSPRGIEFQLDDPVDTFRGREQQFVEVKLAFNQQKNKKHNLVAVCGYGGIGKTQFARMYINKNRKDFHDVIWIYAESESTMRDSFNQVQNILDKNSDYKCNNEQDVYKRLNSEKTIFVFDNSEHIRNLSPFLPKQRNNSLILVTSKEKTWDSFKTVELGKLDPIDAENIMKAILIDNYNHDINDEELKKFANQFEAIPLLLQIRAGYLCDYIQTLRNAGTNFNFNSFLRQLDETVVNKEFPNSYLDPYRKTIYEALYPTLDKIWNNEDDTRYKTITKILKLSAFFNSDYIYKQNLKYVLEIGNEEEFRLCLGTLNRFLLIHVSDEKIQIHRTVQDCILHFLAARNEFE